MSHLDFLVRNINRVLFKSMMMTVSASNSKFESRRDLRYCDINMDVSNVTVARGISHVGGDVASVV